MNSNYKLSPTYPSAFVVPTAVSDGELRQIAHFRARGRVPAVTYVHRNGAVVARCAQPLVGLRRRRCTADEAFMTALRRESGGRLVFVDCRSQVRGPVEGGVRTKDWRLGVLKLTNGRGVGCARS